MVTLLIFVVVELSPYALGSAVEDIHGRPQEVLKIGFEPRVSEARGQCIENVRNRAADRLVLGQEPRIGLVLAWASAGVVWNFWTMKVVRNTVMLQ